MSSTSPDSVAFWQNPRQETILLTTILAMIPIEVLKDMDEQLIANVVGEGKLSVKSMRYVRAAALQ
jgi:hypothetical protein